MSNKPTMTNVLTIAGSDTSAGAGIQADLKTFAAMNVYGLSVETMLTAQNANGIQQVQIIEQEFVRQQLEAIFASFPIEAVKIGAIGTAENASIIAEQLKKTSIKNVVFDPVISSKNGKFDLAKKCVIDAIVSKLFPLCLLVTPNLDEAAQIVGFPLAQNEEEMLEQGRAILKMGCKGVLMKGGHLPSSKTTGQCVDWLLMNINRENGNEIVEYRIIGKFHALGNIHGTGCTLSSTIAAQLALDNNLLDAIKSAKHYLESIIPLSDDRMAFGHNGQNNNKLLYIHHFIEKQPNFYGNNGHQKTDLQRTRIPMNLSLYLVLDPVQCGGHSNSIELLKRTISAGISVVQIRAPEWHKAAIFALAVELRVICHTHNIPLLINDHVDVAMGAGADGVHVGKRDLPVQIVRQLMGDKAIIGFTVNDEAALKQANSFGTMIDYIGVGPVYSTSTKKDLAELIGPDGVHRICSQTEIPTVAIGGINVGNAREIMEIGHSNGLAVCSAICSAADPEEATNLLRKCIKLDE